MKDIYRVFDTVDETYLTEEEIDDCNGRALIENYIVEYGISTFDQNGDVIKIYEGDIIVDHNTLIPDIPTADFELSIEKHQQYLNFNKDAMVEVVGNVRDYA